MKQLVALIILGWSFAFVGCDKEPVVTPYTTVEAAHNAVVNFNGSPEEFLLPVSDELHDSMGITAAIITDAALAKGWQPAGFEQHEGYRIYKFAQMK